MNIIYLLGIAVIGIGMIAAAGYILLNINLESRQLDERNCPSKGEIGYLGLILDLTDPLDQQQTVRLLGKLNLVIDEIAEETLISVGVVHTDTNQQGSKFSSCKLRPGDDANQLYENPTLLKEKYIGNFEIPLQQTIQSMIDVEEQPQSPIIESITSLITSTPGIREKDIPKTLVIVSDLVQNSDIFSFFKDQRWEDFIRTKEYTNLTGVLKDFDIQIIRIPPPKVSSFDILDVDDFWVRYLEKQSVKTIKLDRVTLGKI